MGSIGSTRAEISGWTAGQGEVSCTKARAQEAEAAPGDLAGGQGGLVTGIALRVCAGGWCQGVAVSRLQLAKHVEGVQPVLSHSKDMPHWV